MKQRNLPEMLPSIIGHCRVQRIGYTKEMFEENWEKGNKMQTETNVV